MRCSAIALMAVLSVAAGTSGSELEGAWGLVRVEGDGQGSPAWPAYHKGSYFTCCEYEYITGPGGSNRPPFDLGTYRLDPDQDPKQVDLFAKHPHEGPGENIRRGVYELDGDTLRIALAEPGQPRPTNFSPGSAVEVWK